MSAPSISNNSIEGKIKEIQIDLKKFYCFENEHFEIGHFLHGSKYYFAKRYFESTENCEKLAFLLAAKLKELGYDKNTTLIGFKSYSGLLLSKLQNILPEIDFAIVEQNSNNKFTWQFMPDFNLLKENLFIILPITSTCSTYIRIRKYLESQIRLLRGTGEKQKTVPVIRNWRVCDSFINIFLIQDSELENETHSITINEKKLETILIDQKRIATPLEIKLSGLYANFNWDKISPDRIEFKVNNNNSRKYFGYPLVKLYSDLFLPEQCPLCFPKNGDLTLEKNIFTTHNNFETPNLLEGFPNFGGQHLNSFNEASEKSLFNDLFTSNLSFGPSHLYGHVTVNGGSYLHFIRGNTFYQQNREQILYFFDVVLQQILEAYDANPVSDIVFITSESKHNSTFLDEISNYGVLKKQQTKNAVIINILRFDPDNEFIDNFMSNYATLFKKRNILLIYFEEVISGGKTFKLVSNYLKHYKELSQRENRHGFDYVFSIIDRTPYYTREEIIKKLYSTENTSPEKNFISFFNLNVPIVAAGHLGDPLVENVIHIKKIILDSHLDILKRRIGEELPHNIAKELPEENILVNNINQLKYFPFENEEGVLPNEVFEVYKDLLVNGKLDLLKLYVAHQVNSFLSKYEYLQKTDLQTNSNFIENTINHICDKIEETGECFFTSGYNNVFRIPAIENEIVHDTVIKILSRHPFTYYKRIYDAVFTYCINRLNALRLDIMEQAGIKSFAQFRKVKFYIKRLVDLDSSYLISKEFLLMIRILYEFKDTLDNKSSINDLLTQIENQLSDFTILDFQNTLNLTIYNGLAYKFNQIISFPSFLLYSYKESIHNNRYRSIKLEELLNLSILKPKYVDLPNNTTEELIRLVRDPFYHLRGMIKAENILLLNKVKELHKENYVKYLNDSMYSKLWMDPTRPEAILNYYFKYWKSDPVIINARKFIDKSEYVIRGNEEGNLIKLSVARMLYAATLLYGATAEQGKQEEDLIGEIDGMLKSVISIIQPGIEADCIPGEKESKIGYALCVMYRKKSEADNLTDNIFIISSDKETTGRQISENGLIFNLMHGLYESNEIAIDNQHNEISGDDAKILNRNGIQSLLAGFKVNEEFISLREKYYTALDDGSKYISELYQNDCLNEFPQKGLSLLSKAKMSLFLRLSEINLSQLNLGNFELQGKAVLVVTCSAEPGVSSFLNFMCDEKVRLMLLIKEELLLYLQKKINSDAFIELLKTQEQRDFANSMEHGVNNYFRAMDYFLASKFDLSENKIIMIRFIKNLLHHHFNELSNGNRITRQATTQTQQFSEHQIKELFELIMKTPHLARRTMQEKEYGLEISTGPVSCNQSVFFMVFPEIMINMRRYSLDVPGFKNFRIYRENNTINFENPYDPETNPEPRREKNKGGKEMCKKILGPNVEWKEPKISGNNYKVQLIFKL